MGYWAHMNYAAKTVTVHGGDCPHCKHGFGPKWKGDTRHGKWDGPHGSWVAAYSAARDTIGRHYKVKRCDHCLPENAWGQRSVGVAVGAGSGAARG